MTTCFSEEAAAATHVDSLMECERWTEVTDEVYILHALYVKLKMIHE